MFKRKFNQFIEKWCGSMSAHLLDTDDNEGEKLRNFHEDNYLSKKFVKKKIRNQLNMLSSVFDPEASSELLILEENLGLVNYTE